MDWVRLRDSLDNSPHIITAIEMPAAGNKTLPRSIAGRGPNRRLTRD